MEKNRPESSGAVLRKTQDFNTEGVLNQRSTRRKKTGTAGFGGAENQKTRQASIGLRVSLACARVNESGHHRLRMGCYPVCAGTLFR